MGGRRVTPPTIGSQPGHSLTVDPQGGTGAPHKPLPQQPVQRPTCYRCLAGPASYLCCCCCRCALRSDAPAPPNSACPATTSRRALRWRAIPFTPLLLRTTAYLAPSCASGPCLSCQAPSSSPRTPQLPPRSPRTPQHHCPPAAKPAAPGRPPIYHPTTLTQYTHPPSHHTNPAPEPPRHFPAAPTCSRSLFW